MSDYSKTEAKLRALAAQHDADRYRDCPAPGCRLEEGHGGLHRFPPEVDRLRSALAAALAERDEARATIARLNRRAQEAESAIKERLAKPTDPRGFGRILANGAAAMYKRERDEAVSAAEALRERVSKLEGALRDASASLFRAYNMLSAINDSDPSMDRKHICIDVAESMRRADRSLLTPPPPESPNPEKE